MLGPPFAGIPATTCQHGAGLSAVIILRPGQAGGMSREVGGPGCLGRQLGPPCQRWAHLCESQMPDPVQRAHEPVQKVSAFVQWPGQWQVGPRPMVAIVCDTGCPWYPPCVLGG
jgi:hypothetical protein